MARHESDREDLLRQATALVERAELTLPQATEPVVVGFRRDGSASFFFGAEAVYQFNATGELRRAFLDGLLYKADRGRLWKMRRERGADEVVLVSEELSSAASRGLLSAARSQLSDLAAVLRGREWALVGEVPAGGGLVERITAWLAALPAELQIANRPHAG